MGLNRNCSKIKDCEFRDNDSELIGFGVCLRDGSCSCLSEYGWSGDFCNEVSPTIWLNRFLFILRPIALLCLAVYFASILRMILRFNPENGISSSSNKELKTKRRLAVMVSLNVATCLIFLTYINQIISLFDPTYMETNDSDSKALNGAYLDSKNKFFFEAIRIFGTLAVSASQALLAASWVDIIEGLKEFSKHKTKIKFMVRYRNVLPYIIVVLFLILVGLVETGQEFEVILPFIGVLVVFILMLYIFGSRQIVSVLDELLDRRKVSKTTRLIKRSARLQIYILFFSTMMLGVGYVLQLSKSPEAFFMGARVINGTLVFSAILSMLGISRYSKKILQNMVKTTQIDNRPHSSVLEQEDA